MRLAVSIRWVDGGVEMRTPTYAILSCSREDMSKGWVVDCESMFRRPLILTRAEPPFW